MGPEFNSIIVGIIIMAFFFGFNGLWFWFFFSRSKTIAKGWAEANHLVIKEMRLSFFKRPRAWILSGRGRPVYRITVEGKDNKIREGYLRLGSFWLGIWSDKAEACFDANQADAQNIDGDITPITSEANDNEADMDVIKARLESNLEACIQLLVRVHSVVWTDKLHDCIRRLNNGDLSGIKDLLWDGMGSFIDIYIHPLNGNKLDDRQLTDQDVKLLNKELDQIRQRILTDVKMLVKRRLD